MSLYVVTPNTHDLVRVRVNPDYNRANPNAALSLIVAWTYWLSDGACLSPVTSGTFRGLKSSSEERKAILRRRFKELP